MKKKFQQCSLEQHVQHISSGIQELSLSQMFYSTVKPPIFPTSKTSIPLLIPVFVEPPYLTYGKSLSKFYTSYSFLFQGIGRVIISANAFPRKNWVKIGQKNKSAEKRRKGEKETNTPHLCESLKGLLGGFRSIKTMIEVRVMIITAIFSTQFFVNYIQVLRKSLCSLRQHGMSLDLTVYVWLPPLPRHPSCFHPSLISSLLLLLPPGIIGGFTVLYSYLLCQYGNQLGVKGKPPELCSKFRSHKIRVPQELEQTDHTLGSPDFLLWKWAKNSKQPTLQGKK